MYGQSLSIYLFCLCLVAVSCARTQKFRAKVEDGDRIINGQNTTIDQFPSIVQIVDKYSYSHGFTCGGTLVSDSHVISAAHCFKSTNDGDVAIIVNATYLDDKGVVKQNVTKIYRHPKYNATTDDYDIAILKLKEPVTFGKGVQKAEMCTAPWNDKEKIVVSGWGHTIEKAKKHSNQLQTVKLDTLSNKKCKEIYSDITENMECSVVSKGKDACQGDSGGPAYYEGQLCGIVSYGFGCGRDGLPGVFASIPQLSEFIAEHLSK